MLDLDVLRSAIRDDTILVSLMAANNEIGTTHPIAEIGAITHERGVLFHCDATQYVGKLPLDVNEAKIDLLSMSAHKMYGPKGIGALYVRRRNPRVRLVALIDGGGQEHGLRAGTENVPGVVGFGKACELAVRALNHGEMQRLARLRDRLEAGIRALVPEARRNGHAAERLPNTLNMTLPGTRGESLVLILDRHGVYFSSGSACKSGNPAPSHVLTAIGLSDEAAHCAIRLSLGVGTDDADVDYALAAFGDVLRDSQKSVRFVACR